MAKIFSKANRSTVMVTTAIVATALLVVAACSDRAAEATSSGGTTDPTGACATPQQGCPCSPGTVASCGKTVKSDVDFIYCFEGKRVCGPDGTYGDCTDGTIVTKNYSSLRTAGLGTSGACSGASTAPLRVCSGGKRKGETCTTNAECGAGERRCIGGTDRAAKCKNDGDCQGTCGLFDGKCAGGANNDFGCNADADCPASTCAFPGGGNTCTVFSGVCDSSGPEDGEACNTSADCGGGTCEAGHGKCQGGKANDAKCRKNKHCKGAGVCSADADGGTPALDPCDPYCNVFTDTPAGFDAGVGFVGGDGGISVLGCGDSKLTGFEECDDGNVTSGDGCSASCTIELGFQCPTVGAPCTATTCANGIQEGSEECDDGNLRPFDGCSPTCQREVKCPGGACVATCGDGLKFPSEACDDGNIRDGDGCSSTCAIEPLATCVDVKTTLPSSIDVPVIYRDQTPALNPDFQSWCCSRVFGLVGPLGGPIDVDGTPLLVSTGAPRMITDANSFKDWYHDSANNRTIYGTITLTKTVGNTYVFDSGGNTFYPLNGLGFGNYGGWGKNYHFTSELRYPFTYGGGEVLTFKGDDDVFVYINGKLAVDIGGVHGEITDGITLDAINAATYGLVVGNTYEIAVFQAERHTSGSNYKLTLSGFEKIRSSCAVPTPPPVAIRDFEAVCPAGTTPTWQLFRFRAGVPAGSSIDFRAATADVQSALPPAPPPAAPATVPIGSATNTNSPSGTSFAYETGGAPVAPIPVSERLKTVGNTDSKRWLRVYMTFNGTPSLFEWQQLYDCLPQRVATFGAN